MNVLTKKVATFFPTKMNTTSRPAKLVPKDFQTMTKYFVFGNGSETSSTTC